MSEAGKKSKSIKEISIISQLLNRWKFYGASVIFLFAFLLYANSYWNEYAMDDIFVTAQDPVVKQGIKAIPEILSTPYLTYEKGSADYRPVVKITFAIESQLFGVSPHISHLIQSIFYALCCVALFFLLSRIFALNNILLPITVTLLFAAHPVHTEVVDGLKSRDELLSFFFSLGVLYFFMRAWTENRKWFWIVGSFFYLLAVLSKPSSLILILWVPLILIYMKSPAQWWRLMLPVAYLIILSAGIALAEKYWILSEYNIVRQALYNENPLVEQKDFLIHAGVTLNSLAFYFKKIIFPHPLGWYYGFNTIEIEKPWSATPAFSFLVHLFLFGWALYGLRKKSFYSLAILLYLFAIAPFINVTTLLPGIVAERVMFFASVGFCLALALILTKIARMDLENLKPKVNPVFIILIVTVLGLYSVRVISRNKDWKDELTLFGGDITYLDKSVIAHEKYGILLQQTYQQSGSPERDRWMLEKALKQYQRALELLPDSPESLSRIGEIIATEYNRPKEAMPYFEKVIAAYPDDARFNFDLAYCYELQNDFNAAIHYYHKAMRADSLYMAAWQNISVLFSKIGRNDSAIIYNQVLLDRDINSEHGNANMGFFYKKLGNKDKAIFYFKEALKINPNRSDVTVALDSLIN